MEHIARIRSVGLNIDELRARLRNMSDEKLSEFGEMASYMISPRENIGENASLVYVIQLEEAKAEHRRRRHQKDDEEP